jgi:GT2 family glycosyltransferase
LSRLRDKGLRSAVGDIVTFIDDDVYCKPTWLENIVETFKRDKRIVGVSGPTVITNEYRANRDIFRFRRIKNLYDLLFLQGRTGMPGFLSDCGCPSTASNDIQSSYEGKVDYLEACNMSVKKEEALNVGGFDHNYIGTGEWCEVDLALRLQTRGSLYYCQQAFLYHRPSVKGVFSARLSTKHRWTNFRYFQEKFHGKWIRNTYRTYLYRIFVWLYLKMKNMRMI